MVNQGHIDDDDTSWSQLFFHTSPTQTYLFLPTHFAYDFHLYNIFTFVIL